MRVTILDYGVGNLHSLAKGLAADGVELSIESDPWRAIETNLLVLPGVGAFSAAAAYLSGALAAVRRAIDSGLPTLGICLGMQLLFESSEEGPGAGLGVFSGTVVRLRARRLPHIGWSSVQGMAQPMYYANSYACCPSDASIVTAHSTHEEHTFPAIVRRGTTVGVQFHPEKSSSAGVALLRKLVREVTS